MARVFKKAGRKWLHDPRRREEWVSKGLKNGTELTWQSTFGNLVILNPLPAGQFGRELTFSKVDPFGTSLSQMTVLGDGAMS